MDDRVAPSDAKPLEVATVTDLCGEPAGKGR